MLGGSIRRTGAVLAALALASCADDPAGPGDTAAELRAAPLSVDIDGRSLSLEAHLWRDFMPIAPPQGRPLAAVLRVHASAGTPPAGLEAIAVWVVFGDQLWATETLEIRPPDGSGQPYLEAVARDGPTWGPGVTVDVIVRLRDSARRTYLLRAANQPIGRTD